MSFQYVKIYYGPYESYYTVTHKPQKVTGLRDRLRRLGYRVDLIPVEFINYCMLEMCGHEIFRCNIKNLLFNTPYYMDPVCQRAIRVVQKSTIKLRRASTRLWLWNFLEDEIFKRSEFAPLDYWVKDVDIQSFTPCVDCAKCCGILARPFDNSIDQ